MGYSAGILGDPELIAQVEDFFYIVDDKLGWYPGVVFSSGLTPLYGLNLFYKAGSGHATWDGAYNNDDQWRTGVELSYMRPSWNTVLSGRIERDNDQVFFGIGTDPINDVRSFFLPDASAGQGNFFQRRAYVRLETSLRFAEFWDLVYTTALQRRQIKEPATGTKRLSAVFDVASLPGGQETINQSYNELALRFDTRQDDKRITPGVFLESYSGLSEGLGNDAMRLWRVGGEADIFVPIIRQNRFLVPRLLIDGIINLNDGTPIPFTEYPRHPLFRGVSSRKIIRADRWSLQSSLEYQWPLTPTFLGHLFTDYLMVGHDPSDFSTKDAVWAAGLGILLHQDQADLGEVQITTGSEGIRLLLSVGFATNSGRRLDIR